MAIPPLAPTLVKRPRLVERLHQGVSRRLTLLSAPAGFGKTTLLSEWHASQPGKRYRLAWVSLDEADNDPVRFWSYLIGPLDMLHPGLANDAMSLLYSSPPVPVESVLVPLAETTRLAQPDSRTAGCLTSRKEAVREESRRMADA